MSITTRTVLMLLALSVLAPLSGQAQEGQAWRQREASRDDEVASSDVGAEIRFGREVAARLLGRYGLYSHDRINRYVNLVGQTVARNSNRPELTYHFAVLNTTEINAYASPGGYIFITKGALDNAQDEAELAGILAHEMTHINERHVVRELNIRATEGSAAAGLARLIGGGTEAARIAFYQAVDKAMDILFKTGYKREDETQADTGAVTLCALSGYDPMALARYFERIAAVKGKGTEVLDRTHPAYDARISLIKDVIRREGIDAAGFKGHKERFAEAVSAAK